MIREFEKGAIQTGIQVPALYICLYYYWWIIISLRQKHPVQFFLKSSIPLTFNYRISIAIISLSIIYAVFHVTVKLSTKYIFIFKKTTFMSTICNHQIRSYCGGKVLGYKISVEIKKSNLIIDVSGTRPCPNCS